MPTNGDAHQLLKFIHKLSALRPDFESEADAEKFLTVSRNAIIAAADKLLSEKHAEDQDVEALKAKLGAYQLLLEVGVKDAFPKALKFAERLKEDKRPVLSELGQAAWVDFKMSTIPTADTKGRLAIVDIVAAQLQRKPRDVLRVRHKPGAAARNVGRRQCGGGRL